MHGRWHYSGLRFFIYVILTLQSAYRFYTTQNLQYLLPFVIFSSLLVVTHPDTTVHTCAMVALFWAFWGRNKKGIVGSLITIIGVLFLTTPWWKHVLATHGIQTFLSAMQTGWHSWTFWGPLIRLDFANEPFVGLITLCGVFGLLRCFMQRDYFFCAWFILPFVVEPRIAPQTISLPLAMLSAIGLDEVILPGLQTTRDNNGFTLSSHPLTLALWESKSGQVLLGFFLLYSLWNAGSYSLQLSSVHLSQEEIETTHWVKDNTPEHARFIVLNYGDPLTSPIQEWFPALTGRINLSVVQGYEWLPGEFNRRRASATELSHCIFYDYQCIENWAEKQGFSFDYVLISQSINGTSLDTNDPILGNSVAASMQASSAYRLVYSSTTVKIFQYLGSD